MKNIKYVGTSDFRELAPEDFERHEVKAGEREKEGLRFASGEVIEVTDEVAAFLLDNVSFVNEFEELSDKDLKAEEAAEEAARQKAEEDAAALAAAGDSTTSSTATSTGTGRTGRGSSTSGSGT